jgi:hypothetical protein
MTNPERGTLPQGLGEVDLTVIQGVTIGVEQ